MLANPKAIRQREEDIGGNEDDKTLPLLLLNHQAPPTLLPHILVLTCRQAKGGLWGRAAQAWGRWVVQGQNSGGVKRRFLQPKAMNHITAPSPAV